MKLTKPQIELLHAFANTPDGTRKLNPSGLRTGRVLARLGLLSPHWSGWWEITVAGRLKAIELAREVGR